MFEPVLDCAGKDKLNALCVTVARDTKISPVGGERCSGPSSELTLSDWNIVAEEFQRNHWSYFLQLYPGANSIDDYYLSKWDGHINELKTRLGYRLVLSAAEFESEINKSQNTKATIRLWLENPGWAAPFNPRRVRLILRNRECQNAAVCLSNKEVSVALPDVDPRMWQPNAPKSFEIHGEVEVKALVPGTYYWAIELSDPLIKKSDIAEARKLFPSSNSVETIIGRYSIRFANTAKEGFAWEQATGLNQLGTIEVK
jgi:hypothetical protein